MSSKHTPGPWVAHEIAPDDPEWGACEIWPAENDREDEEGRVKPVATMVMGVENARLIAAAPELLEAAMAFIAPFDGIEVVQDSDIAKARAAIAKATGEAACAS